MGVAVDHIVHDVGTSIIYRRREVEYLVIRLPLDAVEDGVDTMGRVGDPSTQRSAKLWKDIVNWSAHDDVVGVAVDEGSNLAPACVQERNIVASEEFVRRGLGLVLVASESC